MTLSDALVFSGFALIAAGLSFISWPLVVVFAGATLAFVGYRRSAVG